MRRGIVVADSGPGPRQLVEVVARMRRRAGVSLGLEILLRPAGDAGVLQQLAEEGATAARRRTDEV
jgi:hypothetical protein